ncbi:MAG TPA: hypothetical protein VFL91_15330 [Thermomicrobiales bacterium]|nr:hypothetical protein [Thermomicrobiales bacterium]
MSIEQIVQRMSLVQSIGDPDSVVAAWFARHVSAPGCAALANEVNDRVAALVPAVVPGGDMRTVTAAVKFCCHWLFGPLEARPARLGAADCRRAGWAAAEEVAAATIAYGDAHPEVAVRARCAALLATFERYYREEGGEGGLPPGWPAGWTADELDTLVRPPRPDQPDLLGLYDATDDPRERATLALLASAVDDATAADIARLAELAAACWPHGDERVAVNPVFGDRARRGAPEADWVSGGTLYLCRTTWEPRPLGRQHVLQLLGYILLDWQDRYRIRGGGWYFTRQQLRVEYPLDDLIARLCPTGDLPTLRASWRQTLLDDGGRTTAFRPVQARLFASRRGRW